MRGKRTASESRERLATAAAEVLQGSAKGGYSLSAATATPLRRRLRGVWTVVEHTVDGEDFLARFASRAIKGAELEDPIYRAVYEFKDRICIKRVEIEALAPTEEGRVDFRYRMSIALSWDFDAPGLLAIRPELGYQCTELAGETAAIKEFEEQAEITLTTFRFEGDTLVLEEGDDFKRLERAR